MKTLQGIALILILTAPTLLKAQRGAVRQGSPQDAIRYYRLLAPELGFRDRESIL
jgi:hypothetical protein